MIEDCFRVDAISRAGENHPRAGNTPWQARFSVMNLVIAAAAGERIGDISIYGQESNYTTWRLAKMNLAIREIDGRIEQPVVCRVAPRHGMKRIAPGEWIHAYP